MHTSLPIRISRRAPSLARGMLALLLVSLTLLTSACGGDTQIQQQASQSQGKLDALLHQAQVIGVPSSLLQPILKQEQTLSSTRPPFSLFNDQPINDYYSNLTVRYTQLAVQMQGLITTSTEQFQAQAGEGPQPRIGENPIARDVVCRLGVFHAAPSHRVSRAATARKGLSHS